METPTTKPVIYQVFTRLFGNTINNNVPYGTIEENGIGKFNDFTDVALQSLREMGVTHMWYTGVIEHAVLTDYTEFGIQLDDADVVKGRAGSPYAIKDYYDVNPDMAVDVNNRMQEFEALIQRTHDNGMKVLIDFVPNHVARGYISDAKPEGIMDFGEDDNKEESFDPNNNFYYMVGEAFNVPAEYNSIGDNEHPTKDGEFDEFPAKATGNDVFTPSPSVNDWFETVKLNYGVDYQNGRATYFDPVPDTWNKMEEVLSFWASKGVDGFRCDMAEMVPVEFWGWVIPRIKSINPEITFTAEIYNPDSYRNYIFNGKFDYLYDKVELYDTLKHIIQNKASTDDITVIWQRQEGIEANMLRFLENHDEQRIASPDFAGSAENAIPA
ncbi:MAG: alpha-amylase family glycosyl hydrolase, partial [Bacteroidota bacterium]